MRRFKLMVLAVLCAWVFGAVPAAEASSAWGSDVRPTTAQISQALYGSDSEQYDTSESDDEDAPEEVTQAG